MDYLIGLILAIALCGVARLVGFDRERVFYPTMLIVIATYYILFAAMVADSEALSLESMIASAFLIAAVVGFKFNLWIVVVALAGHGMFDLIHHRFFSSNGVPMWWPGFCAAFHIAAAIFLGGLLVKRSNFAVTKSATK